MRNEDFILLHFLKFALSGDPAIGFDKESADWNDFALYRISLKNTLMI